MSGFVTWECAWAELQSQDFIVYSYGNFAWMMPMKKRDDDDVKEPAPAPKELEPVE